MVFLAGAIGTGVVGFLQHQKWREADDAVTSTSNKIDEIKGEIFVTCQNMNPDNPSASADCIQRVTNYAEGKNPDGSPTIVNDPVLEGRPLQILNQHFAANNTVRDSFNKGRIIFFSAAAVSLAISITLFAW
jgi:hypothetical protein